MKVNWLRFQTVHGTVHVACFMGQLCSAYHEPANALKEMRPWRREQKVFWEGVLSSNCEARA
jgi:hypothetical protein